MKCQVVGEIQLIRRKRQLGKDEQSGPCFRRGVNESSVPLDVGVDITPAVDNLGGGQRATA